MNIVSKKASNQKKKEGEVNQLYFLTFSLDSNLVPASHIYSWWTWLKTVSSFDEDLQALERREDTNQDVNKNGKVKKEKGDL